MKESTRRSLYSKYLAAVSVDALTNGAYVDDMKEVTFKPFAQNKTQAKLLWEASEELRSINLIYKMKRLKDLLNLSMLELLRLTRVHFQCCLSLAMFARFLDLKKSCAPGDQLINH